MADTPERLENPISRFSLVLLRTAADTDGALLEMEATYGPHSQPPPEHFHPNQTERFEVLEGRMRVAIDGGERVLAVGDVLDIPPGQAHAMWNDGEVPARVNWQTRPAMRTEHFFREVMTLAKRGLANARGGPPLLRAAVLARLYRDEIRLTKPPPAVQAVVLPVLALFGRVFLGYRPGTPWKA